MGSPEVGGADTRFVVLSVLFFITTTRFEVEDLRLREPKNRISIVENCVLGLRKFQLNFFSLMYR